MSPFWGNFAGVMTIILMVIFIGIWIWAWRKKHKNVFDQLAAIPMEDDLEGVANDGDNRG
jgi:cytochrome c oxidase cbb3-type subunit IV